MSAKNVVKFLEKKFQNGIKMWFVIDETGLISYEWFNTRREARQHIKRMNKKHRTQHYTMQTTVIPLNVDDHEVY